MNGETGGPPRGAGRLFLCPTPIGNLEDITFRIIRILRVVDHVLAEDTRRTRRLLSHYDINKPLLSFHDHNETGRVPQVIGLLESGRDIALVSDAGYPLLADPGFRLVREAIARGLPVIALPGPSSILPALVLSGFPTHPFTFLGFLPRKVGQRRRVLEKVAALAWTAVCFESPFRLLATLEDVRDILGPEWPVAVARELTKKFEEVIRGPVERVIERFGGEAPRGEVILVISAGEKPR